MVNGEWIKPILSINRLPFTICHLPFAIYGFSRVDSAGKNPP
jgi:hypothetical protein